MNRRSFLALGILVLMIFTLVPFTNAEVKEGMTQGEFALWVAKEAGALKRLPPAASGKEAIDFLTSLGIIPENGWDQDAPADDAFLTSLLPIDFKGEVGEGASLQDRVLDFVRSRFDNRSTGVFRVQAASASSPS